MFVLFFFFFFVVEYEFFFFFFFQAEDGIRDLTVTGVQTCALPICSVSGRARNRALAGTGSAGRASRSCGRASGNTALIAAATGYRQRSSAAAPHLTHHTHAVDRRRLGLPDAVPGQRNERVFERATAGLLSQRRGGAMCHDPAVVDDRNPVGDALRLLHVVCREKHRHLLVAAEGADKFPDLVAGLGVEPAGRLVEEQDARPVLQGAGDFEPALHAAGEPFDVVVAPLPQADEAQQSFDALAAL